MYNIVLSAVRTRFSALIDDGTSSSDVVILQRSTPYLNGTINTTGTDAQWDELTDNHNARMYIQYPGGP